MSSPPRSSTLYGFATLPGRAPRIQQQHSLMLVRHGDVGVPEDDHACVGEPAQESAFATSPRSGIVDHPNADASEVRDELITCAPLGNIGTVVVADHGMNRGILGKLIEHVGCRDVARMDDCVGSAKRLDQSGGQPRRVRRNMCVRDDEDSHCVHRRSEDLSKLLPSRT